MPFIAAEIPVLCVCGCVGGWALYSPGGWLYMFYRGVREVWENEAVTAGCKDTNGLTHTHIHTHGRQQAIKSVASLDDPCVPFALCAMLLCAEPSCNSALCLRAAMKDTKLIRLPPGGRDDSLMTLADANLYTHLTRTPSSTRGDKYTFMVMQISLGCLIFEHMHTPFIEGGH